MRLEEYLSRIGYAGEPHADLDTLTALHRLHLDAIPFENLDVQLGRPVLISPEAVFDKLVAHRRGGWCYEMNTLMGWALGQIGFDVTRLAGGVARQQMGDQQLGNHLCLLVKLDRDYLVDVGFGGALRAPLPLARGMRRDAPFEVGLEPIEDGLWRFLEVEPNGAPFSFDFQPTPADEALIAQKCVSQQSAPTSPFVLNLVAKRRQGERCLTLRGRIFSELGPEGPAKRLLSSAEDLVATLKEQFGLDVPETAALWPRIRARHAELFPEDDGSAVA